MTAAPTLKSFDEGPLLLDSFVIGKNAQEIAAFMDMQRIAFSELQQAEDDVAGFVSRLRNKGEVGAAWAEWFECSGIVAMAEELSASARSYYNSHPELHKQGFSQWYKHGVDVEMRLIEAAMPAVAKEIEGELGDEDFFSGEVIGRMMRRAFEQVSVDWPADKRSLVEKVVAIGEGIGEQSFRLSQRIETLLRQAPERGYELSRD